MTTPTNPDDLFTLPLEQFTAARNALAKELARTGNTEQAATVRRLSKPSRTAWALNQLARRQPADVSNLLDAGEQLRQAQTAALDGDASQLRAASRSEQAMVEKLVAAAVELLPRGSAASVTTQEKLRRTLRAAALDPATGTLLREGRLLSDVEASGFGLESLGDPFAAPTKAAPAGATEAAEAAKAEEQRLVRREVFRLRREAERAQQRARRMWDDAEQAERRAADARERADEAAAAAVEAQRQADQAAARAEEAARQAADVGADADADADGGW